MHTSGSESGEQGYTRRQFLGRLTESLFALLALATAVPLVGSAIGPAIQRRKERWIDVGPISDVKPGAPLRVDIAYQNTDGWLLKRIHDAAYVVTHDAKSVFVLSNVCTHLACRVRWEDARQAFYCPCHNATFNMDGNVVTGPPPRPLDRLTHRIENGRIQIKVG